VIKQKQHLRAMRKSTYRETPARCKRGRNLVTPQLAATLDRMKVSNHKAVFVIAETIKSVSHSVNNYVLNTESIRKQRRAHQIFQSAKLNEELHEGDFSLVVHLGW